TTHTQPGRTNRGSGRRGSWWIPVRGMEEEWHEHLLHALDFGSLVGVHPGSEPVHGLLLPRARTEQPIHHRDRALVVLDHEREEQAVELGPARAVEPGQLLGAQHPR